MKYNIHNFFKMKNYILDNILMSGLGRMKPKDFTRDRKINATDIILYNMNNHGKTIKMKLYNFIQKVEKEKISSLGFLKQRLKLDPYIFKLINSDLLFDLYNFFQDIEK